MGDYAFKLVIIHQFQQTFGYRYRCVTRISSGRERIRRSFWYHVQFRDRQIRAFAASLSITSYRRGNSSRDTGFAPLDINAILSERKVSDSVSDDVQIPSASFHPVWSAESIAYNDQH